MESGHVFNLICFLVGTFFFIGWCRAYFSILSFKKKYVLTLAENKRIMSLYWFTGQQANKLAVKYNELFNKIIITRFDGTFEEFAQWAIQNKMQNFGQEIPLDLTRVDEILKSIENESTRIANQ